MGKALFQAAAHNCVTVNSSKTIYSWPSALFITTTQHPSSHLYVMFGTFLNNFVLSLFWIFYIYVKLIAFLLPVFDYIL